VSVSKAPKDDVRDASYRVAIAKSALDAIDEAMRGLRLQRKAAEAKYHQRLAENTAAILAGKTAAASTGAAHAGGEGSA
jgi:hypothetical protein